MTVGPFYSVLDLPELNLLGEDDSSPFFLIKSPEQVIQNVHYISGDFWKLFEKKQKLGEGTSAVVRKCVEVSTKKEYAVKIVRTRDEEIVSLVSLG